MAREKAMDALPWYIPKFEFDPSDGILYNMGVYGADAVSWLHASIGTPWWLSIIGATFFVRAGIFYFAVVQQRMQTRLFNIMPKLSKLQEEFNNPYIPVQERQRLQRMVLDIQKQHGIKQSHIFLPVLFQAPIFISFFFGLRMLAHSDPTMLTGGMSFFEDLTTWDQTLVFPILSAMGFASTILISQKGKYALPQSPMMRRVMIGFAAGMVPFSVAFPKAVFLYWITNNFLSATQLLLFNISSTRRILGIPEPDPDAVRLRRLMLALDSPDKKKKETPWDAIHNMSKQARAQVATAKPEELESTNEVPVVHQPNAAKPDDSVEAKPVPLQMAKMIKGKSTVQVETFKYPPKKPVDGKK